jgi:hypothetical protein
MSRFCCKKMFTTDIGKYPRISSNALCCVFFGCIANWISKTVSYLSYDPLNYNHVFLQTGPQKWFHITFDFTCLQLYKLNSFFGIFSSRSKSSCNNLQHATTASVGHAAFLQDFIVGAVSLLLYRLRASNSLQQPYVSTLPLIFSH